ncbi:MULTISPECIES: alpha/beta hydrolase [Staphylococcus]|uniref:Alpha/beta hydrolase family protein n=1 Tax=Staphylococcus hsinchuensis TaxID=3051183 RepID=A0ABZ3EEG3_9STAP|nr:alpha/beta hydrolase family protein [Staphylococcus sp. Marseille-Q5304]
MAFLSLNYKSKTIGKDQTLSVILPEDDSYFDSKAQPKQLKSLMLLHGLSSDSTSYVRYTSIERYANEHQLAIIMPSADHSFYSNMKYGHSYYDYILEVYDYVHQVLPLSRERKDNFIAGHSMGGYGTMKYALTQGARFAKACSLSAVFKAETFMYINWPDFSPEAIAGTNKQTQGTDLDLYHLVDQAAESKMQLPELLIMCGRTDELFDENVRFIHYLDDKGIDYQFKDEPGNHDYAYWDHAIKQAIEWMVES